ncbi:MAG: hypothetical protein IJS62_07615 [Bacteroidales bacterium]|nr:hypothetical protein [Bacteroidales bacterium]
MRRFGLIVMLLSLALAASGKAGTGTPVAIVVDSATFSAVGSSVEKYASAIRKFDRKEALVLVAAPAWSPSVIRDTLRSLHDAKGLEGAVLVGDIPVPMIRRAHHLATAFKMNPSMPWKRSSIPSDRFYDDFGLRFKFLKNEGALWYYDLQPEGDQFVKCDIYTARIKPPKTDPSHSFTDLVAEFLDRAAAAKAEAPQPLDRLFHFGGHGNSSESINARIDENRAMYEQFSIDGVGGSVSFLNFDEERVIRARLKSVLADKNLDYAHLHTHGGVRAQYLSKEPYTFMASEHIRNARAFLRGKMRSAKEKDREKLKSSLMESYGVPASWLEDWDDPVLALQDSLRSASVDLVLSDLDGYASGVRLLILDACFNGAFLHDDYVAARYAFSHGSASLAVFGNSVNIIQDHWKNELAGLLSCGVCVGNWAKCNMTLESHLFGDPTFRFAAVPGVPADLDAIVASGPSAKQLKRLSRCTPVDVRAYAMKCGADVDPGASMNLRMEKFMLSVRNAASVQELGAAIRTGLGDSYELIRRMAARYAEQCGDPALLPLLVQRYLNPLETSRVRYHLLNAFGLYPFEDLQAAFNRYYDGIWPVREDYDAFLSRIQKSRISSETEFAAISRPGEASLKERSMTVSAQRNACNPSAVAPMLEVIADEGGDAGLRCKAAEALGWYVYSVKRADIYKALKGLDIKDVEVADEVTRSIRRLEDNAHLR